MSGTSLLVIVVLVMVVAPVVRVLVRRAREAHAAVDRILDESCPPSVVEPGPDPLRLLAGLDAHLNAYAATVADLYEPAAAPTVLHHPGLDQLRQAVRDEQKNGDQT